MIRRSYDVTIHAPRPMVFALLADLRGYEAWLPHSESFKGTREISEGPTRLGTTYSETDGFGTRHGRVTDYAEPSRICFAQPMTLRPSFFGRVDVRLEHVLAEVPQGTRLIRTIELDFSGPVRLAAPLVARRFDREIRRILDHLSRHAETLAGAAAGISPTGPSGL